MYYLLCICRDTPCFPYQSTAFLICRSGFSWMRRGAVTLWYHNLHQISDNELEKVKVMIIFQLVLLKSLLIAIQHH